MFSRLSNGIINASAKRSRYYINLSTARVSSSSFLNNVTAHTRAEKNANLILLGIISASSALTISMFHNSDPSHNGILSHTTKCDSSDILGLGKITKEPATGIMFPQLCNGMTFAGCGVRVKWGIIKVYAVGTYVDPIAMSAVKKQGEKGITKALLDPHYPRTIRIVMNRNLSIDKYTKVIIEALEPRMNGEDLEKLEEFKNTIPPVDLIDGAEIEMTIRGDTMLYKNSTGGIGHIKSAVFCRALCDVYYGSDAVSPAHRDDVIKGTGGL